MATGDQNDMLGRLRAALPRGWFPDTAPILTGVLSGLSNTWSWVYSLLTYAKQQTRIATATEGWLDAISTDLFGDRLPRRNQESDDIYRERIKNNILQPANTRSALVTVLTDLTGRAPSVFEPANAGDTGGYATDSLYYGQLGGYGSYQLPFQAFVTAYRGTAAQGIPAAAGYDDQEGGYSTHAGYGSGALVYGSASEISGAVTDADIYAAAANVVPAGSIVWMRITDGPTASLRIVDVPGPDFILGLNFILGESSLS